MGAENNQNDVMDISIPVSDKKRYRINGDNEKIIMINPSDMGIVERMETGLKELREAATSIKDTELTGEALSEFIRETDNKMRGILNGIFDYDVASACAPSGTMVDVVDGQFMYEHIMSALTTLYENNLAEEYKKMQNRLNKHTAKYTKKAK